MYVLKTEHIDNFLTNFKDFQYTIKNKSASCKIDVSNLCVKRFEKDLKKII